MSIEDKIILLIESIQNLDKTLKNYLSKVNENNDKERLIPVTKWNEYHSWPKQGGLRHLIFHEKTNGASCWIKRAGRRILIDENEFFKWCRNNQFN